MRERRKGGGIRRRGKEGGGGDRSRATLFFTSRVLKEGHPPVSPFIHGMGGTAKRRLSFSGKSTKRHRSFKAYRRYRKTVRTNRRRNGIVGNSYHGTCKYVQQLSMTCGAGSTSEYRYRLNSIFKPDVDFTGHQPYGRDTLNTLYNRYRVKKVKYVITMKPNGLQAGSMYAVVHDGSTTYNALTGTGFFEQPHCQFKAVRSSDPTRLSGTINLAKFFGVKKSEYQDDRFQAQMDASPAELIVLSFGHQFPAITAATYDVYLKYYIEAFDPKMLAQS